MLNVFAAFSQFEREIMLERQAEGIAKARSEGKYTGRRPTARTKAPEIVTLFRDEQKSLAEIARGHRSGTRVSVSGPRRRPHWTGCLLGLGC
jgi:DNA invertase Pin-like site-specific DNA recombinase